MKKTAALARNERAFRYARLAAAAIIVVVLIALLIAQAVNWYRAQETYAVLREHAAMTTAATPENWDVYLNEVDEKYRPNQDYWEFEPLWVSKAYSEFERDEKVNVLMGAAVMLRNEDVPRVYKRELWTAGALMTEYPLTATEYQLLSRLVAIRSLEWLNEKGL